MRHTLFDRLRVSARVGDYHPVGEEEEPDMDTPEQAPPDTEAEFGGREARLNLERKLLRKLDMRMSILVLIYILNYVRLPIVIWFCALISVHR
jgi:DNA-directed RNA polymerase specialized sigma24 family protein